MANLQTFYVDLSLDNSVVGEGTESNKYSWGDVQRWFTLLASSPLDTGDALDRGIPFDMSSISFEFRMTGRRAMTSADKIELSGIQFFLGAFIRFTSDAPASKGIPVWSFPSSTVLDTFISITDCTSPDIRVQGVLLDVEGNVGKLLSITSAQGKATVENNVAVLKNRTTLLNINATFGSVAFAGNTVLVGSIASGQHVLVGSAGGSTTLKVSHNIIGQHSSSGSALVGISSEASSTVVASGNVWAIRPNGAPYTGVYPSANSGSPDVFGQDIADVVYNDPDFGGTGTSFRTLLSADTNKARGCSEFTLSFARAKHTSQAIGIISSQSNVADGADVGYIDITGKLRTGKLDAGAVQKSELGYSSIIHVDLSLPTAVRFNAIGTEEDPIGAADWAIDAVRRAPVDNEVRYEISGSMGESITPLSLSFGAGVGYVGTGSITVSGWKTFNRDLPTLRTTGVVLNQAINTIFSKIHLEWTGNQDLLSVPSSGVLANDKYLRVVNATVRSSISNTGRFVVLPTVAPVLEMCGVSAALKHTSSVAQASGYIALDADLAHVIALSAFELGNQRTLMTVPAQTQINGVYATSPAGEVTIVGAVPFDSAMEGAPAFADTDAEVPDFSLVSDSVAIGILAGETSVPVSVRTLAKTDCRDLERSAFPYGSTALDAGAYETGYKTYPDTHVYVDLSKTSTGHVGTSLDKFSLTDLAGWIDSLKTSTLTRKYVVHLLRRHESGSPVIDLSGIEGNPSIGGLSFVTDNGKSCAVLNSTESPTIVAYGSKGLSLDLSRLLIGANSGFGPIALSGADGTKNKLTVKNSVLQWVHGKVGFIVSRSGGFGANEYITINSTTFNLPQNTSDDAADFSALIASISNDATIGQVVRVDAIEEGTSYRIVATSSTVITVNSSANISTDRESGLIAADSSWSVKLGAVSVSDVFPADLSLQTTVVPNAATDLVAVAIESAGIGSSKIGVVADNPVNVIGLAYPSNATMPTPTGLSVNERQSTSTLFLDAASGDLDQADFKLRGAASTSAIIIGAQLPTWAKSLNVDMAGSLRFMTTAESMDAGAIEYSGIVPSGTYDPTTASPIVSRTTVGQAMHMRAEADGPLAVANRYNASKVRDANPFSYTIVGYQLLNAGYTYWQPTQPTEIADFSGTPASATITVSPANSFDATSYVSIGYLDRTAIVSYAPIAGQTAGFEAGATAAKTAESIAKILRSASIDNIPLESVMWIAVSGNTLTLTSKLLGTVGNDITVLATGTGLSGTDMAGGLDATDPNGQVYPASGWVPFDKTEAPDPYSLSFAIKLGVGQANTAFGAIVVVAKVTGSPVDSEVGKVFPFAVVRMPLESKHERKTISCRVLFT